MPIQSARPVSGKFNQANKPTGSTSQKLCFLPEYPGFDLSEMFALGGRSLGLEGGWKGSSGFGRAAPLPSLHSLELAVLFFSPPWPLARAHLDGDNRAAAKLGVSVGPKVPLTLQPIGSLTLILFLNPLGLGTEVFVNLVCKQSIDLCSLRRVSMFQVGVTCQTLGLPSLAGSSWS